MRFFSFLALVALLAVVGLFAYENRGDVTVQFWDRKLTAPLALVAGAVYVLGMFTGWSVIGMFRSTLSRVTEAPPPRK